MGYLHSQTPRFLFFLYIFFQFSFSRELLNVSEDTSARTVVCQLVYTYIYMYPTLKDKLVFIIKNCSGMI